MTADSTREMQTVLENAYPILSDPANKVARTYKLVFALPADLRPVYAKFGIDLPADNGDDTFELPVPATYVISQDGTIRWADIDIDYTSRAEPRDILAALAALSP